MRFKQFGLIGKNIEYSFSKKYFEKKFLSIEKYKNYNYKNFDVEHISEIEVIYEEENLSGLNVTIPYKEKVIPYLDGLSDCAKEIGAVNTIIFKNGKKIGDNTDAIGFELALKEFTTEFGVKALILGSGGASKAIEFVLNKNKIDLLVVSRNPKGNQIRYSDISQKLVDNYPLIVNCSPIGTFPKINDFPKIPYEYMSNKNHLFDLIYNPKETQFMKKGLNNGAKVCNGYKMLVLQAEASWKLWK
jgi:shikimate dehydrogenase